MKIILTIFALSLFLILNVPAFAQESSSVVADTEQTIEQQEVDPNHTDMDLPMDKADKKRKKEVDPEKEAEKEAEKARKEARKADKKSEKEEEQRLKDEETARIRQYDRNSPKMLKMAGKQPN